MARPCGVTDALDDKIYAYKMSDKSRDPAKDFDTLEAAGNMAPHGLWSDGTTMWVADYTDAQVYAYHLSNDAVLSSLTLSDGAGLTPGFDGAIARYTVSVSYAITNLTIAAAAWHTNAVVSIAPSDADSASQGHQVALAVGANDIAITVTPSSGLARTYTIAVRRGTFVTSRNPAQDFNTLDRTNTSPQSMWSNGTTLWVAEARNSKIYAYKLSDKTRDPSKDFNNLIAAGNSYSPDLWSDGTTMWVIDAAANKLYAYHAPPSGDATLRALALSGVDIGAFSSGRLRYTAGVAATNAMTTITAVANHAQASMSILPADADADAAGHQVALAEGNNPITITLTAPNRSSRTYTITLHRALSNDAALQSLALSGIPLNFSSDTTHYTAPVSHLTLSTTVQVVASDPNARLAIVPADADADTAGHQVALAEGNNTIAATVIAPNRSSRTYTITLHRALSGDVSFGALGLKPVLTFGQVTGRPTLYRATVAATTTAVTLTATAKHDKAQVVIWGEDAATTTAGHQVALTEGDNPIALAVIAANGAAQTYSIIVSRPAPALSGRQAQPRGFQTASVAKEKKESRRTKAAAFSGGVRFELVMPLTRARSGAFAVEASSRLVGGVWRLLQPEEEYRLVWKDNQDGTAHMTLTLPQANANQSFLRLKPTN